MTNEWSIIERKEITSKFLLGIKKSVEFTYLRNLQKASLNNELNIFLCTKNPLRS